MVTAGSERMHFAVHHILIRAVPKALIALAWGSDVEPSTALSLAVLLGFGALMAYAALRWADEHWRVALAALCTTIVFAMGTFVVAGEFPSRYKYTTSLLLLSAAVSVTRGKQRAVLVVALLVLWLPWFPATRSRTQGVSWSAQIATRCSSSRTARVQILPVNPPSWFVDVAC
jgi:uncharacterized membrane protein YfcA